MGSKPSIIVLFYFSIITCSCEKILTSLPHQTYNFGEIEMSISNKSGYDMRIEAFDKNDLLDVINIKNDSYLTSKTTSSLKPFMPNKLFNLFDESFNNGQRDSILIYFNNKRVIIQKCSFNNNSDCYLDPNRDKKNLNFVLSEPNKVKQNCSKKLDKCFTKTEVTFTPDDYARAIPIESLKKN